MGDRLNVNTQLLHGESLTSWNRQFTFVHQHDGNVVLYQGKRALWSTNTCGRSTTHLTMQSDGNLVLYNGIIPVWASNTWHSGANFFIVQDDGNICLYDGNQAKWARFGPAAK